MEFWEKARNLEASCKELYIYGAGMYGRNIYKMLKREAVDIAGFVVTKKTGESFVLGLPVVEFNSVSSRNIGIITGVNRLNAVSVRKELESAQFDLEKVIWGHEVIDMQGVRGGYDQMPTVEITTQIGCRVNCKFCPQSTLLSKYFENSPNRDSIMSLKTFAECLDHFPADGTVLFSGMAEPFLNPACIEMIKLAVSTGRTVDLYTTLVGADAEVIGQICEIPFGFVTLHLADRYGYAHIPVSEEYYRNIERLVNSRKKDGTPFINICNAQAEPDERIQKICEGKYEILTALHDRAGNLNDARLITKECLSGPISCSMCGQELNHNILLPDGTLLLCCMDYGMQHVLGNLRESPYQEILSGAEFARIKRGMLGEEKVDILCRHCSCANPY